MRAIGYWGLYKSLARLFEVCGVINVLEGICLVPSTQYRLTASSLSYLLASPEACWLSALVLAPFC